MKNPPWVWALLALGGAAQAQSGVVLQGALDAGQVKRSGARLAIGQRAADTPGFKGVEELGPGLKALFQFEIRYEPDGGSARLPLPGPHWTCLPGGVDALRIGRGAGACMEAPGAAEPWRGRSPAAGNSTTAWVLGANYTLATGTLLLGYGRAAPGGTAGNGLWSLGYAYPLSRRSYAYADASDLKAASAPRQLTLGIRAAF